jgi:hypothetical protein
MFRNLAKIANKLDSLGFTKEADLLDRYLQKAAQQVATTGVAGATYGTSPMERGRQITPGKPGGAVIKFYKAKPKSIGEFNNYLAALIDDVAETDILNQIFSRSTVSNSKQLSTQTNWSSLTASAFKEYATAVGAPDAGIDWQKYAKSHNYEPTMSGIYAFWADTVERAIELGGKQEGKITSYEEAQATRGPSSSDRDGGLSVGPSIGPNTDKDEMERFIREKEREVARQKKQPKEPIDRSTLEGRLRWHFTGGTGIKLWWDKSGGFQTETDTKKALELIRGVRTPEAKSWFSQSPRIVLPDEFTKYSDIYDIKTWAAQQRDSGVTNFNKEVESVYMQLADLFKESERSIRDRERK